MKVSLAQLKAVVAVYQTRSIVKAAEILNITQPAVTTRIKNIEEISGSVLFDRSNQMMPTQKCRQIIKMAEEYIYLNAKIAEFVSDKISIDLIFRIGVSETIAQYWLSDFVKKMHEYFPHLTVEITVENSENLENMLIKSEIDIAILMGPIVGVSIRNIFLNPVEMSWYCPKKIENTPDLNNFPVITFPIKYQPFLKLKNSLFSLYGSDVKIYTSNSISAALRLISDGFAVGALPSIPLINAQLKKFELELPLYELNFTISFLESGNIDLKSEIARIAKQTENNIYNSYKDL